MFTYLIMGIMLGMAAGFSPGPLLTLVVTETLQYGIKAGIKVALSPVITDLPIILMTVFVIGELSGFHSLLGGVSLIGGGLIFYMGLDSFRVKGVAFTIDREPSKSLAKGTVVNLLNPHPYLFWFSVGAPTITRSMNQGYSAPTAFLLGFYLLLVGSKIALALLVGRSKSFLTNTWYAYTMRFLGVILWGLAAILFLDGLKLLGLI